jgi:hypothetical protein
MLGVLKLVCIDSPTCDLAAAGGVVVAAVHTAGRSVAGTFLSLAAHGQPPPVVQPPAQQTTAACSQGMGQQVATQSPTVPMVACQCLRL